MVKEEDFIREVGYYEYFIRAFKDLLSEQVDNAIKSVSKKQSRNYSEMEEEVITEKFVERIDSDSEDEKPVYNPKNVPLGWDGKYSYFNPQAYSLLVV